MDQKLTYSDQNLIDDILRASGTAVGRGLTLERYDLSEDGQPGLRQMVAKLTRPSVSDAERRQKLTEAIELLVSIRGE